MRALSDALSVVLSIGLLLLVNRIGGERLRKALQKWRAHWIHWLFLAAVVGLLAWLLWRHYS
jgi:membrane protein DedA with SNARE-associated domain